MVFFGLFWIFFVTFKSNLTGNLRLCKPTGRHEQRFDVVRVEDSDQVIERTQEPAAGVFVHLHQVVHLEQTLLRALHLRHRNITWYFICKDELNLNYDF